jgi:hypothetical protein
MEVERPSSHHHRTHSLDRRVQDLGVDLNFASEPPVVQAIDLVVGAGDESVEGRRDIQDDARRYCLVGLALRRTTSKSGS